MNIFKKRFFGILKKFKFLPQEYYARIYYEYYYDKKLNLEQPVEFNEKIQWLKVYYHPPVLHQLVDKYEVRKYVEEKTGKKYLNELYGLYNKVSEVNLEELPNQFVLKTTHGYNNNIIVRDKSKLDRSKSKYLLHKWMFFNQYYLGGQEWAYKNVPHRIVAEKYLSEIDNKGVSDYKFYCFNGKPEFIEVNIKKESKVWRSYLDTSWNPLEFSRNKIPLYDKQVEKPESLEEMVRVAEKLAGKFPFVRVDLYEINRRIIFGELTFYPADARHPFSPEKYNKIIGDKMVLPEIPEGKNEITEI